MITLPSARLRRFKKGSVLLALVLAALTVSMAAYAMDYIEGDMGAVDFDHESHTYMASGCSDCHHTHGRDNTRCRSCHEIPPEGFRDTVKSSFMGCPNCHGDIDPESPEIPSLQVALHTTCLGCHRDMGTIGQDPAGCMMQCHKPAEPTEGER